MAVAVAAQVVPVAAATAVQAVAAAARVAAVAVQVQVAAVAAAARVAAVQVEAVTAAAAVEAGVAGMVRTAAVVEVKAAATEAVAARETAAPPKVAIVIVQVITTRRVLVVTARVLGTAIGTGAANVIETAIVTVIETVIVTGIETGIVIGIAFERGQEILPAIFAIENAIASVTKGGGENVSAAATSIPRGCICRRIMAAMDTAQTRMIRVTTTACTRARTMRAGARVTIRAAHIFTSMAPAGFYPSLAVRLGTVRPIAMAFCADMKRGTSITKTILPAAAFIDYEQTLLSFIFDRGWGIRGLLQIAGCRRDLRAGTEGFEIQRNQKSDQDRFRVEEPVDAGAVQRHAAEGN